MRAETVCVVAGIQSLGECSCAICQCQCIAASIALVPEETVYTLTAKYETEGMKVRKGMYLDDMLIKLELRRCCNCIAGTSSCFEEQKVEGTLPKHNIDQQGGCVYLHSLHTPIVLGWEKGRRKNKKYRRCLANSRLHRLQFYHSLKH